MADIVDLMEYIAPEVMGCPDPLIDREVLFTARKLCDHSKIWEETDETLPVVATLNSITFNVSVTNTEIISIEYVMYDGIPLTPITEAELNARVQNWREDTASQPTHYIPKIKDKTARLYPVPSSTDADALTYKIVLRPSMEATELPDFLTQDYLQVLIDGALSRLFNMKKQEWYDPAEAARRRKELKKGIFKANGDKDRGISSYNEQTINTTLA